MPDVQTNLRLPFELKEHLQQAATLAGRSLSAEAAHRLERAFALEAQIQLAEARATSNVEQFKAMAQEFAKMRHHLDQVLAENAMLKERARFIDETRESDIQSATKHLAERSDALVARAASAEREVASLSSALHSQELMTKTLAQFIGTQASLSTPMPGTERVHRLMNELAQNVAGRANADLVEQLSGLTDALKDYVARSRSAREHIEPAGFHPEEVRLDAGVVPSPGLGFQPKTARGRRATPKT